MDTKILYPDLSYKIVGICMKIHRDYGCYHNERIYHNLIKEQFAINQIFYESSPKIFVFSRESGKKIGVYVPDFLVDKVIILELKAKPTVDKRDEIQLAEYLKTTPYEVGYLINFGLPSLYYKRIIYTNDRKNFLSESK